MYQIHISCSAMSIFKHFAKRAKEPGELQYPVCPLDGNKVKTFDQTTEGIKCTSNHSCVCYLELGMS